MSVLKGFYLSNLILFDRKAKFQQANDLNLLPNIFSLNTEAHLKLKD